MADRFAHCTFCGARFTPGQPWPRRCAACGEHSYRNPTPVAVALQPIGSGLLCVRRAIPPGLHELAFPGGYLEFGETWQAACVRELFEETGLRAELATVRLFDTISAPDATLLVFGLLPPLPDASSLPPSAPNDESLGWEILPGPAELAFSLHSAMADRWFAARS